VPDVPVLVKVRPHTVYTPAQEADDRLVTRMAACAVVFCD